MAYPNTIISYNQKIVGRYSKTKCQIDIPINTYLARKRIKMIIDVKYYNKIINVKDVETFIAMVEDIEAVQGVLITSKGYSRTV